jgi:hypothetical protein
MVHAEAVIMTKLGTKTIVRDAAAPVSVGAGVAANGSGRMVLSDQAVSTAAAQV